MALTTWDLTGNITDLLGEAFAAKHVTVTLLCSEKLFSDGGTGARVGNGQAATIGSDGSLSFLDLPDSSSGHPLYRLAVVAKGEGREKPTEETTGWFEMTADRTLAWVVENSVTVSTVTAAVVAQIDAAVAAAGSNLDDWAASSTGHYLHGVSSINGLPLDPAGTLLAVENAILAHPDDVVMIDLDYRATAEGALASIHDATTVNISDVTVTVADTSFRDLPEVYRPGLYGTGQDRQPIGLVETILVQARGRCVFSIEIKDGLPAVAEATGLADRLGMADKIVWNTGDPDVVAAIVAAGGRAFMFNCNSESDYDAAATAGAWMVDVPTDASTALIDYAVSKGFERIIRGFATTAGVATATSKFSDVASIDARLDGYASDATGYLDRPGGATARSRSSIAGSVRTGKRGPGWLLVNSGSITDWLAPGRLYTYKAGPMVYTFGDLAGTIATTGTLTVKVVFDTLPTTVTQSTRFKLFSPTEHPTNASANSVDGYILGIQADGVVFLNTASGGAVTNVLPNISGAALVAGTEYTVTVEWDDTDPLNKLIRVTRVDTGGTSGWVNETTGGKAIHRGSYHSAYTTQTTGVGAVTDLAIA